MRDAWEPYLEDIQGRINRLFDHSMQRRRDEPYDQGLTPPVDVIEQEDALVVRAELPGVAREDVELNVENGTLFLSGEKRADKNVPGDAYRRSERSYGRFARSFVLPRAVDAGKIDASLRDGVLEIRLPKAQGAMPRRIAVG